MLEVLGMASVDDALDWPLVGLISRMVEQKGFDLMADVADELPRLGASSCWAAASGATGTSG